MSLAYFQECSAEQIKRKVDLRDKYNSGTYMRSLLCKQSANGGIEFLLPLRYLNTVSIVRYRSVWMFGCIDFISRVHKTL